MFSLLTFNIFHTPFSGVSIADFELVNASWDSRYSCVKFENAPLFMTFIGNFKALICLLRSCFLIQPTEQINICLKLSRQVFTSSKFEIIQSSIYFFKVKNGNPNEICYVWNNVSNRFSEAMSEICSKLAITTPERSHCCRSGFFLFFLLTLTRFHKWFYCFHSWLWTSKCRLKYMERLN